MHLGSINENINARNSELGTIHKAAFISGLSNNKLKLYNIGTHVC